jgi:hypothetical protein
MKTDNKQLKQKYIVIGKYHSLKDSQDVSYGFFFLTRLTYDLGGMVDFCSTFPTVSPFNLLHENFK